MPDGTVPALKARLAPLLRFGAVMGIKAANILAGVVVTLLLARAGGPQVLGQFAMAIQTAQLVSILAVMGCDQLALREVAANLRIGQPGTARAHLLHYLGFTARLGTGVALVYAVVVWQLGERGAAAASDGSLMAALAYVVTNVAYLMGLGAMRGLESRIRAQIFDGVHNFPLAIGLGTLLLLGWQVTAVASVLGAAICLAGALLVLFWLLWRSMRLWPHDHATPPPSPWQYGTPMMLISFMMFFSQWLPQFLAGVLVSPQDAGIFRSAFQLALPFTVVQTTTSAMISAAISGDLREGRVNQARRRVRNYRLATLAITLPVALPLILWPGVVVELLFGAKFAAAAPLVQVMVAGNMMGLIAGPNGAVITMAGRNRDTLPIVAGGTLLTLAISLLLTPRIGLIGTALGFAGGLLLRELLSWRIAHRILTEQPEAVDQPASG